LELCRSGLMRVVNVCVLRCRYVCCCSHCSGNI
jgi:hypothetical protein